MLKEALTTSSKFLQIKEELMKRTEVIGTAPNTLSELDSKINSVIFSIWNLCDLLHELAIEEDAVNEYNRTFMGKEK